MPEAIRSSAASQEAGSRVPRAVRISGVRRRSGWSRVSAAVNPLMQSAPLLTGNSASPDTASTPSAPPSLIPHWKAQ